MLLSEDAGHIRAVIMDSLIARSGKVIAPQIINDITAEIMQRFAEITDKRAAQLMKELKQS